MTPERFDKLVTTHSKFRMFLISRLPMAWIAGLRVKHFDTERCEITIPYKYLTKNPFSSIYFAAQSMAAELSTGLFCFRYAQLGTPRVSMLVVNMESKFFKKATGLITFTCADGAAVQNIVETAQQTGEGQELVMTSVGKDADGDVVSEFVIRWSFKAKSKK